MISNTNPVANDDDPRILKSNYDESDLLNDFGGTGDVSFDEACDSPPPDMNRTSENFDSKVLTHSSNDYKPSECKYTSFLVFNHSHTLCLLSIFFFQDELMRLQKIQKNNEKMRQLGLIKEKDPLPKKKHSQNKKRSSSIPLKVKSTRPRRSGKFLIFVLFVYSLLFIILIYIQLQKLIIQV
jgi:hypothetical protein